MVFTDNILFVHCPKTAGTFFRGVLVTEVDGKDSGGGHDPAWFIEGSMELDTRSLVGIIRDPWSWYVSFYLHARRNGAEYDRQLALWGNGSVEYRDVLYGWTHPSEVEEMPLSLGVVFAAAGHKDYHLRDCGVGFATWVSRYFYGRLGAAKTRCEPKWLVDTLIPTDRLYEASSTLLNIQVTEEDHPRINTRASMGATNPGSMGPLDPREWYDDEMLRWVDEADEEIITLMGWPGPFEPASNPYIHLGAN